MSIFYIILIIIFLLIIEGVVIWTILDILNSYAKQTKTIVIILYILLSLLMLYLFFNMRNIPDKQWSTGFKNISIASLLGFYGAKIIIVIFTSINFLILVGQFFANKIGKEKPKKEEVIAVHKMSRSRFLSYMGIGMGTLLFGTLVNGIRNRYQYQLKKVKIPVNNLDPILSQLKIIQISDIHAGSFDSPEEVQKGIDMIMEQNPDLIVFTGDIVNNIAKELEPYQNIFSQLKAPLGVYSVLGNHDYGDYYRWDSQEEKAQNLEDLKNMQEKMGWQLLMNEHKVLDFKGSPFNLIGVENWGAKGQFPKHGKLDEAVKDIDQNQLSILMSHDPSHWDAEIKPSYSFIDLTLSGHTHGMQFGVRLPFMQWSPVKFMYEQWEGLYTDKNQYLYVNVGFGYLGYPGRVGIMPEITLIEFEEKENS